MYMSQRYILTVRRVIALYPTLVGLPILLEASWLFNILQLANELPLSYFFRSPMHFVLFLQLSLKFKILWIKFVAIKTKQSYHNSIDVKKYKSVYTILYVLAVCFLGFVPYLCWAFIFPISKEHGAVCYGASFAVQLWCLLHLSANLVVLQPFAV